MNFISLMQLGYDALQEFMKEASTVADAGDEEKESINPVLDVTPLPSVLNTVAPIKAPAKVMRTSVSGLIELADYEAMSNQIYLDSGGVRTIGIGMTKTEVPNIDILPWSYAITDKMAVALYVGALVKYEDALNRALKVKIKQYEYDALLSLTYNIGIGAMAKSTFMARVNAKAAAKDVVEAMQRFKYDNGKVVKGLENRRAAEARLYLTGQYTNNGTCTRIKVDLKTHKPIYGGSVDLAQYLKG